MSTDVQRKGRIVFLDLDDTLYKKSTGFARCVSQRISQYMSEILHIENADVKSVELYHQYGTTLTGLLENGYKIDPIEYYHYVHSGIEIHDKITKDDVHLQSLLRRIRQAHAPDLYDLRIFIFTNADRQHCFRFVDHLNIRSLVDGFVCFEDMLFSCKPHPDAFNVAMKLALQTEFETAGSDDKWWVDNWTIWFADDNIKNVKAAIEYGWNGVWICEDPHQQHYEGVPRISEVLEIENVFPELFGHNLK